MSGTIYTTEERRVINEYIRKNPGVSGRALAQELGNIINRSPDGLRDYIRCKKYLQPIEPTLDDLIAQFPIIKPSFKIAPPCILTGDWHLPYVNLGWFRSLLLVARETGIRSLAVIGDFHNFDFFSKYWADSRASAELQEKEFVAGEKLLDEAMGVFKQIYFCFSGHDRRPNRLLQGALTTSRWYGLIRPGRSMQDIYISPFAWAEVGETWIAMHPRRGRKIKGSLVREMVSRRRKSTATFHQHYSSWAIDPSGTDACVDVGSMCDRNRIGYMNVDLTPYPEGENAFLLIDKNERGHLFVDHPRYPSVEQMLRGINN